MMLPQPTWFSAARTRWAACAILFATATTTCAGGSARAALTPAGDQSTAGWLVNTSGARSAAFDAPVNVQSVTVEGERVRVISRGIPDYTTEVTAGLLAGLLSHAASEFRAGQPSISLGQRISFGQDVGFRRQTCPGGASSSGYWPPTPAACGAPNDVQGVFPLTPRPTTAGLGTPLGQIGLWINGVPIFNWSDAQTYRDQGVWQRTALVWEGNSMDVCGGHAVRTEYHSHAYPNCLAEQLRDDGSQPSPIYGYAADGYPIYGPWRAAGVLAKSGWKLRDYDSLNSPTGCGAPGVRSCLLADQLDVSRGVVAAQQPGPTTSALVASGPAGNVQAVPGAFFEDYFFDGGCTDCLDEHNGRDDQDGRGYHYVLTVSASGDGLTPVFPFILGPRYAGEVAPGFRAPMAGGQGQGGRAGGPFGLGGTLGGAPVGPPGPPSGRQR